MKLKTIALLTVIFLNACSMVTVEPPAPKPENINRQIIIGEVEPVYFPPMKSPFYARIDTGALGSAIDVRNPKLFERDGEKWVSFTLTNRETGEKYKFEKPIIKNITIKRIGEDEKRVLIKMDMKFGDRIITENFSLADREKFEYQALVGRNILTGRAIVDTSLSYTLQ